ncbi:MAG TPA: hypothetical protein VFW33_14495 [Gemmataceae bacterium]|nr:hypothetical protein [Gemmataceae bacterium]
MARSLSLLVLLAFGSLVPAAPPERPSGRTALDPVEDGLRRYRTAGTPESRRLWLKRLAKTHDLRVAVALGEALNDESPLVARWAAIELAWEYMPGPRDARSADRRLAEVDGWWQEAQQGKEKFCSPDPVPLLAVVVLPPSFRENAAAEL